MLYFASGDDLHVHLGVVDEILQWVSAGELVQDSANVCDDSTVEIIRNDLARDVDELNPGEVIEKSSPRLLYSL